MKAIFIIWLGAVFIFGAVQVLLLVWKLIRVARKMLSGWDVDWLSLATAIICGIVLASYSWPVMIGILICWQLASKF